MKDKNSKQMSGAKLYPECNHDLALYCCCMVKETSLLACELSTATSEMALAINNYYKTSNQTSCN